MSEYLCSPELPLDFDVQKEVSRIKNNFISNRADYVNGVLRELECLRDMKGFEDIEMLQQMIKVRIDFWNDVKDWL